MSVHSILEGMAKVFPSCIAFKIKQAVRAFGPDRDFPGIESVGDIETVGDCRYAMVATDANGQRYRVTVEVMP